MTRLLNVLQWATVAAMFVGAAALWPLAPDRITIHWTLTGRPDGYAGKLEGLFVLPVIALLLLVGLRLLPRVDPRRANYRSFSSAYALACFAIVAFLAAVDATVLAIALGWTVSVSL